ncbi:MAG TPA: ABC transporter permease [Longimicrobiales bacterium]
MKLRGIFRFELAYQLRRPWPWLAFSALLIFAFQNTRAGVVPVTLPQDFILNSPFIITTVTVFSSMIWLLVASPLAGEAGARDISSGIHPLVYATPVTRLEYLGGKFLAAFVLNAFVLLGVQGGSVLGVYAGGVDPAIIGPFRITAYLAAYAFIALPNAFIASTVQFTFALVSGRSMASYAASVMLLFFAAPVPLIVWMVLGEPVIAKLMDPIGLMAIMNEMMSEWTIVEKNVRMFTLQGPMLWNRALWVGIASVTLSVVYLRFRFHHRTAVAMPWTRVARRFAPKLQSPATASRKDVRVPGATQTFGPATHLRQVASVAGSSFRMIATSPAGLFLLAAFPAMLAFLLPFESEHWGVPLMPRTDYILTKHLTGALLAPNNYWLVVPLLILYFAGELVWRERDTGLSENVDATPVPDWVLLLGKFCGLSLALAAMMVMVTVSGVIGQTVMGYHDYRLDVYAKILFGLQLPGYLLFAVLALVINVAINQKHVALIVSLVAYVCLIFARRLGIEHNLLIYSGGPGWLYSDLRGFGGSIAPWAWFKAYWGAWALAFLVLARLMWVRGRETGVSARLRIARRRISGRTAGVLATAVALVVGLGGFVFYNTNILNDYNSASSSIERRAEYERRYGRYDGIAQPERTATSVRLEIYPERGAATVSGSYTLVNNTDLAIDSLHVAPTPVVHTRITTDRPAALVLDDKVLHHQIYRLARPLQPGESMKLLFDVSYEPRGFRNDGGSEAITPLASRFTGSMLPGIGYQTSRELTSPDERREQGLPRKVTYPAPDDVSPEIATGSGATFEAVVGTSAGQTAVAPGTLRREWTEGGRHYFHYAADQPINGMIIFYSSAYAVHREMWKDVEIKVFLHPRHAANLETVLRSARASLDYYTTNFGPYPHRFLQIIEEPRDYLGMGVDGSGVVTGGEGFFILKPRPEGLNLPFQVVAHEVGHLWWGSQLKYAPAEGAPLLSESLAWYSAMQVVEDELGKEQLRELMRHMREPSPIPPIRTGLPLLRAMDPYAGNRKGPFAFFALAEYIGDDKVNLALRRLLEKNRNTATTTLELYDELNAVTPDSSKTLLRDLFETDTYWTFDTKKATAVQTPDGRWQVTFELDAHKAMADSAGKESTLPMDELVEIGVFAEAVPGRILGEPLYVKKHRIRTGLQTITITVPVKPARGGIDPYNLLDWEEGDNIETIVTNTAG